MGLAPVVSEPYSGLKASMFFNHLILIQCLSEMTIYINKDAVVSPVRSASYLIPFINPVLFHST